MNRKINYLLFGTLLSLGAFSTRSVRAENNGFQLNRFEPTTAGEWSIAVDRPWYSDMRRFALGLTFDYRRDPLVHQNFDNTTGALLSKDVIIGHQLTGHLDFALALWRFNFSLSAPITLYENGNAGYGVTPLESGSVAFGDPRFGVMFRTYNNPQRDAFSISLGANIWVPLRKFTDQIPAQSSEQELRVLPKIVLGGVVANRHLAWSLTGGYLWRPDATIGNLVGSTEGRTASQELQLGASLLYTDYRRGFAFGPEAVLRTPVHNGNAFKQDHTNLEVYLGAHWTIKKQVQLSVFGGTGITTAPGTANLTAGVRIAYAPMKNEGNPPPRKIVTSPPAPADADKDGILDKDDKCPMRHKNESGLPEDTRTEFYGCPAIDTDRDGVYDHEDLCLTIHKGEHPDPSRLGCPLPDTDGDGIVDVDDHCKTDAGRASDNPDENGCPEVLVRRQGSQFVTIKPIFFETDKDTILQESYPLLDQLATLIRESTDIHKIRIEGHTDSVASPSYNLELSRRRAASVKQWLVEKGIDTNLLESFGFGEQCPVDTNETDQGRANNRRVMFYITDPAPDGLIILKKQCVGAKKTSKKSATGKKRSQ